jgi:hypothetical protein
MTVHQETTMHPVTGPLASLDFSHIRDPAAIIRISIVLKLFKTLMIGVKLLNFPASLHVDFKLQENNGDGSRNTVT